MRLASPRDFLIVSLILIVLCGGSLPTYAADSVVLGFENERQWEAWQPVEFPDIPATDYRFDTANEQVCGRADRSASGLARKFPGSLSEWPVLSWEWKVDSTLDKGNARRQSGDDYAARVYVNFERGDSWGLWESTKASMYETFYGAELPGQSLNFIWANRLKRGHTVESPYTERARLIALRSGSDSTGEWVRETVDVRDWYRRTFGDSPPTVQSVAIMTDADNTGSRARGCYRRLRLYGETSATSKPSE